MDGFESAAIDQLQRAHRSELDKREAKIRALQREVRNLKADRDELLDSTEELRTKTYPPPAIVKPVVKHPGGDTVRVIIPDVHGSMMDKAAVTAFLADLRQLDPNEIIIMGDLVECGGFLARHHTLGFVAQTTYTYEEDIAHANWLLDEIITAAPNASLEWLEGNHEDRVERWAIDVASSDGRDAEFLRRALSPQILLRAEERNIAYYRRSVIYNVPNRPGWIKKGKIFFTHQLKGGRNSAMSSLAATAGNVCLAHTHQESSATLNLPGVGLIKAFNAGCLCQLQPLWRHTDPTGWNHGYGLQFISNTTEEFLNINVPIMDGVSLLGGLTSRVR